MSESPAKQIRNYEPNDWDEFVLEWLEGFDPQYSFADRLDGAGDKGRDVVGYLGDPNSGCEWDNYQCKHYSDPLQPNHIWIELGKLCVFTFRGDFSIPRKYRFVAPRGVGTKLHDFLREPEKLRTELITLWPEKCECSISKAESFPLKGELLEYVSTFDFSICGYVPVNKLLEQHRRTRYWYQRFGIEPPTRPTDEIPPVEPLPEETRYVEALMKAYGDHLKIDVSSPGDLINGTPTQKHFNRSREWFYSAESLNRFSRDQVEPGTFDKLKKEVFDGIIDIVESEHPDGFERIKMTTDKAQTILPSQSKLTGYVTPGDKKGICHHLVNDERIDWMG